MGSPKELRHAQAEALREAADEIRDQYTCDPNLRGENDWECVAFDDAIRFLRVTAHEIDGQTSSVQKHYTSRDMVLAYVCGAIFASMVCAMLAVVF